VAGPRPLRRWRRGAAAYSQQLLGGVRALLRAASAPAAAPHCRCGAGQELRGALADSCGSGCCHAGAGAGAGADWLRWPALEAALPLCRSNSGVANPSAATAWLVDGPAL
jgi:hypothetical protein